MHDGIQKRKVTPESLIEEMWRLQAAFGPAIDKLWQSYMTPMLGRIERARSGFLDLARTVARHALRFGDTKAFVDLSDRFITETYTLGALYMRERDEQARKLLRLPPVNATFRINKAAAETALVAGYSFSLVDKAAVDNLSQVHRMWFTDRTGAVYNDVNFDEAARALIEGGKSGFQISESLKVAAETKYGIGRAAGKGLSYWSGVAEHAATTAGVAGQLTTLQELGWTRYVVVNPMDERTTKVCQAMNGKTLLVDHGVANLGATLAAQTPDQVRAAKPFVSGGSPKALETAIGSKLTPGEKDLSTSQSLALSKAGFAMPPYHFRCRSFIDISFEIGSIPGV